jgi:hypothetical protein
LRTVDPGFDTRNLLTFGLDPTLIGYKTPQIDAFYRELQDRLAAVASIESVSYSNVPLLSGNMWRTGVHLPGTPKDKHEDADHLQVGANFFSTMHMQLLVGQGFTSEDFAQAEVAYQKERERESAVEAKDAGIAAPNISAGNTAENVPKEAPLAVIVNKSFVQKFFPKVNPVGQHFEVNDTPRVVVGVVNDAKYRDLRSAMEPTMYSPASGGSTTFSLRTRANPMALVRRCAVWSVRWIAIYRCLTSAHRRRLLMVCCIESA